MWFKFMYFDPRYFMCSIKSRSIFQYHGLHWVKLPGTQSRWRHIMCSIGLWRLNVLDTEQTSRSVCKIKRSLYLKHKHLDSFSVRQFFSMLLRVHRRLPFTKWVFQGLEYWYHYHNIKTPITWSLHPSCMILDATYLMEFNALGTDKMIPVIQPHYV